MMKMMKMMKMNENMRIIVHITNGPESSENRRQIGGYIIAPRAHLTAKTEGRSGVTSSFLF